MTPGAPPVGPFCAGRNATPEAPPEAELRRVCAAARRAGAAVGITAALALLPDAFAQVLEDPRPAV